MQQVHNLIPFCETLRLTLTMANSIVRDKKLHTD